MKTKHMLTASIAVGALAGMGAFAQETAKPAEAPKPAQAATPAEPGKVPPLFGKADADGDGKISLPDLKKAVPNFPDRRFGELDADQDGALTAEEFRAVRELSAEGRGKGMFERADEDKDGKLTSEEFTKAYPRIGASRFKTMDANQDGALTPDEMTPSRGGAVAGIIRRADADKDGKVSKEEFGKADPKGAEERFMSLDLNGDGFLTEKDIEPGRAAAGGANFAQMRDQLIAEGDADKDGKLTPEELEKAKPGFPAATFQRLDGNSDGAISAEDTAPTKPTAARRGAAGQAQGGMREAMDKADTDKDGKVSQEEAIAGIPKMTEERFKLRDRNGDGFLSREDRGVPPAVPAPAKPGAKPAKPEAPAKADGKPEAAKQETAPAASN